VLPLGREPIGSQQAGHARTIAYCVGFQESPQARTANGIGRWRTKAGPARPLHSNRVWLRKAAPEEA
jgi:hypothetical protein